MSPSALTWRAALAACFLVLGLAPGMAQDSDAARIKKLETEVSNLRIMVGTLESLVRTAPGTAMATQGSVSAPPQDDLGPRIKALETQIGALTSQVEQMGRKMSALEAKLDAAPAPAVTGALSDKVDALDDKMGALETKLDATPKTGTIETQVGVLTSQVEQMSRKMSALEAKLDAAPKTAATPEPAPKADASEDVATPRPTIMPAPAKKPKPAEPEPAETAETAEAEPTPVVPQVVVPEPEERFDPTKPRWYGPRPGEESGQGSGAPQSISPPQATGALPQSFAALPNENAQALYEQGYGDFMQRDYPAAAKSFRKLVETYPNDPLAGSAQYWIGETYYVRKEYKKAADSFLAGYHKYSGSDKAPDTLLRLGMSLAALGKTEAACSTYQELKDKFPDAPASVRDQAKGEAGKAGC